jgi:hypothetical protein
VYASIAFGKRAFVFFPVVTLDQLVMDLTGHLDEQFKIEKARLINQFIIQKEGGLILKWGPP